MITGLDQISGKAERKAKRAEKKEARQEKRADKKEARQEKKTARKTKRAAKKTARVEKRAVRKEKRAVKQAKRVEKRQARGGSRLKKVALAIPRAGFTVVLKLNGLKLATKFTEAFKKDPAAVKKFAARFGYKWSNFAQYVNQGAKSNVLSGLSGYDAQIGEPTLAAAITSASAIIAAALGFLKKLGINPGQEVEDAVEDSGAVDDLELAAADPEPGAEPAPEPESGGLEKIPTPLFIIGGLAIWYFGFRNNNQ